MAFLDRELFVSAGSNVRVANRPLPQYYINPLAYGARINASLLEPSAEPISL